MAYLLRIADGNRMSMYGSAAVPLPPTASSSAQNRGATRGSAASVSSSSSIGETATSTSVLPAGHSRSGGGGGGAGGVFQSLSTLLHGGSDKISASKASAATAPTMTDDQLYARAVDYTNLYDILSAPLPNASSSVKGEGVGGAAPTASATTRSSHFRRIAEDTRSGITLYSSPIDGFPIHLMRATAVMPCTPSEMLEYTSNDIRPRWDTYTRESRVIRELAPPRVQDPQAARSSVLAVHKQDQKKLPTSLSATAGQHLSYFSESSSSSLSSCTPFAFAPGQRRVAIHYLGVKSPVFLVQDRDFELVVAEEVLSDGTACMNAFSTTMGYAMPLDPSQTRFVRAACVSGLVARPLNVQTEDDRVRLLPSSLRDCAAGTQFCRLDYFGVVHPMGLVPPVLVNMVISAQIKTLNTLQKFILRNPMGKLRPRSATILHHVSPPPPGNPESKAILSDALGAESNSSTAGGGAKSSLSSSKDSQNSRKSTDSSTHKSRKPAEGERDTQRQGSQSSLPNEKSSKQQGRGTLWWRKTRARIVSKL